MKATIEFNLNEPEDAMAHMRCVKAADMAIALFEIRYNLVRRLADLQEMDSSDELDFVTLLGAELEVIFNQLGVEIEQLIN